MLWFLAGPLLSLPVFRSSELLTTLFLSEFLFPSAFLSGAPLCWPVRHLLEFLSLYAPLLSLEPFACLWSVLYEPLSGLLSERRSECFREPPSLSKSRSEFRVELLCPPALSGRLWFEPLEQLPFESDCRSANDFWRAEFGSE